MLNFGDFAIITCIVAFLVYFCSLNYNFNQDDKKGN